MKHNKKKPRNEFVGCVANSSDGKLEFTYEPQSGKFSVSGGVGYFSERSYNRPLKPKILSHIPAPEGSGYFDTFKAIQASFDQIIALDTNTKTINGRSVSVTGIVVARPVWVGSTSGPPEKAWQYFTPFCIEFCELRGEKEKIGWSAALQVLEGRGIVDRSSRVGVIVDAYLAEHKQINLRLKTFDGYNFLPLHWQLVYATSDGGKEDFVNQMIGLADRHSHALLTELSSCDVEPLAPSSASGKPWSGMRLLFPGACAVG